MRTQPHYFKTSRSRQTGLDVTVAHSDALGLDVDVDCAWWTLCESHGFLVSHPTLALARSHAADPLGWCEDCIDEHTQHPATTNGDTK